MPESLEIEYHNEIEYFERERNMRYITTAERIGIKKGIVEGMQQGIQKGMQQGMLKGERTILLRLLFRKFGNAVNNYQKHIEQANNEQLLNWAELLITANSLDEIFTK